MGTQIIEEQFNEQFKEARRRVFETPWSKVHSSSSWKEIMPFSPPRQTIAFSMALTPVQVIIKSRWEQEAPGFYDRLKKRIQDRLSHCRTLLIKMLPTFQQKGLSATEVLALERFLAYVHDWTVDEFLYEPLPLHIAPPPQWMDSGFLYRFYDSWIRESTTGEQRATSEEYSSSHDIGQTSDKSRRGRPKKEDQSGNLLDYFDNKYKGKYSAVMEQLVEKGFCQANTYTWIRSEIGALTEFALLIKHLHAQGFIKTKPGPKEIQKIAEETFCLKVSTGTISNAKPLEGDAGARHGAFSFIGPATTYNND